MRRRCWLELRLESARQRLLLRPSTMEFAQEVLLLKEDERLKTTIFLWKWWSVRNKMKKGERGQSSREIVGDVLNMIEDLGRRTN